LESILTNSLLSCVENSELGALDQHGHRSCEIYLWKETHRFYNCKFFDLEEEKFKYFRYWKFYNFSCLEHSVHFVWQVLAHKIYQNKCESTIKVCHREQWIWILELILRFGFVHSGKCGVDPDEPVDVKCKRHDINKVITYPLTFGMMSNGGREMKCYFVDVNGVVTRFNTRNPPIQIMHLLPEFGTVDVRVKGTNSAGLTSKWSHPYKGFYILNDVWKGIKNFYLW